MKSIPYHLFIVAIVTVAGANTAALAATSESRTVENHIFVSNEAGDQTSAEPREPVTYLGVAVVPVDGALASQLQLGEGQGLVVSFVEPDGPAAAAGLRQHDVLTKLDDQILIEPRQLSVLVRNRHEGDTVAITYLRAGREEQADVTLAQHVPSARHALRWMGKGTPEILYRAENLGPSLNMDAHRIRRTPNGDFTIPRTPAFDFLRRSGSNGERVTILRPQTNVVLSDEAGTLILSTDENERVLTAKDSDGNVIFEGPVGTPEQLEDLPEELRDRIEKLEILELMEPPPPLPGPPLPPPATSGFGRAGGVL